MHCVRVYSILTHSMYKYGDLLYIYMGAEFEKSVIHSAIVGVIRCVNDKKCNKLHNTS